MEFLKKIKAFFKRPERKRVRTLRIWKLGSLEHRIMPTEQAINRLAELLVQWNGEGDLDLIWGPELTVEEHVVYDDEINAIATNPGIRIIHPENGKISIEGSEASGV